MLTGEKNEREGRQARRRPCGQTQHPHPHHHHHHRRDDGESGEGTLEAGEVERTSFGGGNLQGGGGGGEI